MSRSVGPAVDLGRGATLPRVCALVNASLAESLLEGLEAFTAAHGPQLALRVHYAHELEEERVSTAAVRQDLAAADLVLLDLRGSGRATALAASALAASGNTVVCLVGGTPDVLGLLRMGSFSMQELLARNWGKCVRYWGHGGPENVKNLLAFLGREYLGLRLPKPPGPLEFPEAGLYDPLGRAFYPSVAAYRTAVGFDPAKPTVGLLFYGGMHFGQSVAGAEALARRLSPNHNLLPVFSASQENLRSVERFFLAGGRAAVDAVIYLQWFQLTAFSEAAAGASVALLKRLGVPIFAGAPLYGRELAAWEESDQGLSPVEVLTTVILPELDGMIEPVPSVALVERVHAGTGQVLKAAAAIEAQVDRIANRVRRRVALGRTPNAEKRVAFVIYNNPPGEDNIGNAAYLDVFASVREVFRALAGRGYRVGALPSNADLQKRLVDTGAVNNARWVPQGKSLAGAVTISVERYRDLWRVPPDPEELLQAWGEPSGEIMAGEGKVILPVLEAGNALVGLQPARGIHSDPAKITHDKTLPPHHQYLAFYRWLEEDWKADAVVHVGTHGTLEFLKGKEVGMSGRCYPTLHLGSLPHFYLYHVVNPSEAMIAKRRSLGTVVNHASPPLTVAGLYDAYCDLEGLVAEHLEAALSDPQRAARVAVQVREKAAALHLERETVAEIQEELALLKRSLIPKGLHVLDEELTPEEAAETVTYFLRYDRGETPSLHRLLARGKGLDYDHLLDAPAEIVQGRPGLARLEALEAEAQGLVAETLASGRPAGDSALAAPLTWALDLHARMTRRREISSLLDALDGGYTEPGIGGEPLRDPDTLPTGRNSFQFDPRLVPSEAAYERGRQIAENTLAHYRKLHGEYPKSVGVILWAFETAKTRGETVGQVFAYLGVRPVRRSPWKTELQVIARAGARPAAHRRDGPDLRVLPRPLPQRRGPDAPGLRDGVGPGRGARAELRPGAHPGRARGARARPRARERPASRRLPGVRPPARRVRHARHQLDRDRRLEDRAGLGRYLHEQHEPRLRPQRPRRALRGPLSRAPRHGGGGEPGARHPRLRDRGPGSLLRVLRRAVANRRSRPGQGAGATHHRHHQGAAAHRDGGRGPGAGRAHSAPEPPVDRRAPRARGPRRPEGERPGGVPDRLRRHHPRRGRLGLVGGDHPLRGRRGDVFPALGEQPLRRRGGSSATRRGCATRLLGGDRRRACPAAGAPPGAGRSD